MAVRIGPFNKVRPDHDQYLADRRLYWLHWILIAAYGLAVLFYLVGPVNSTRFEHTYVKHPTAAGILTSQRYTIFWFAYAMATGCVVLVPALIMTLLIFRATSFGCNVAWFSIFVIIGVIHVFSLLVLSTAYVQCNKSGQRDNPCNSVVWCCDPAIAADPINDCPNTLPCAFASVPTLYPNADFIWIFYANVYFFLLHLAYVSLVLTYWTAAD
jgi:hypothetical protein